MTKQNIIEQVKALPIENNCVSDLRKSDWLCLPAGGKPHDDETQLFKDVRRDVRLNGKQFEYKDTPEVPEQFKGDFRQEFASLDPEMFRASYGYYNQSLSGFIKSVMINSCPEGFLIQCQASKNLYEKEGVCYFTTKLYNIWQADTIHTPYPSLSIPGSVETTYTLTEKGFLLTSVITSNSLVEELCLGNHDVMVTAEKIHQAQQQEEFECAKTELEETLQNPDYREPLKEIGQAILEYITTKIDRPLGTDPL
jgi:hypothetical protein